MNFYIPFANRNRFCLPKIIVRTMKLTLAILLVAILQLSAFTASYAQKVTIKEKGVGLEKIFSEIGKQTNFNFIYDFDLLQNAKTVTINVNGVDLSAALNICFKNQPFTYEIKSQTIIVKPILKKSEQLTQALLIDVKGKVTDEKNEALIGVAVKIKGTNTGTTTNLDGSFSISVKNGDILVFSYIGFQTQEVRYNGVENIRVTLLIDNKGLEEIVVVGYGTQNRQQVSSAVSTVKMSNVDQGAGYNPVKMLQGRASGINVVSPSGIPGARPVVLIRGVGSISGNSSPLFVVDGVPNEGGYPNINPNDIESMEVLKDASAASIYGSRANSGVVLITTKAGKAGKTSIDLDIRNGSGIVAHDIPMANSTEYANVMQVAVDNFNRQRGTSLTFYRPPANEIEETDWTKVVQRPSAKTSNYNLSISGGNDKTTFFTSFGVYNQEGILRTSEYDQYSYRMKVSHKINSFIQLNTNLSLALTDRDLIEEENSGLKVLRTAREEQPWYSPYTANGDYKVNGTLLLRHNPIMLLNEETWNSKRYEGIGSVSLDIKPFAGFKYTPSIRAFGTFFEEKKTLTERMVARSLSAGWGAIAQNKDTRLRYVIENLFQYNNNIGDLEYTVLAGHSFEKSTSEDFGVLSDNYANGAFPSSSFGLINAGPNIYPNGFGFSGFALESYISRLNLAYKGKYMLNTSLRIDGASKFSKNERYGTFPAVSGAWLINKEDFMDKQKLFNELKLRASYGITGSISGVGNFASRSLVTAGNNSYNGVSGFSLNQIAQPLSWEKAKQINLGIDASILNNRLSFTLDVFQQRTTDLLYDKPVQASSGYTTIASNIGVMENKGIEFSTLGKILNKGVKWQLGANISFVKNRLVSLIDNTDFLIVPSSGSNLYGGQMHALITGQPISTFFIYEQTGIYQNDTEVPTALFAKGVRAGDVIYRDVNGDNDITEADRLNVGKAIPDFYGGFTSDVSYKGFELSIFGQFSVGNKVMASWRGVNGTEGTDHLGNAFGNTRLLDGTTVEQFFGIRKEVANNYWNGPGTSNTTPRPVRRGVHTGYGTAGYNFLTSTRFLEDASYLKFKTATIAYNIPSSVFKVKSIAGIRVFATVDNLFTITKYSGYDPEQSFDTSPGSSNYGVDFGLQPTLRTFLLGLNVKF
jgi:TonB-linked SusC/RagA family outer membrane protein